MSRRVWMVPGPTDVLPEVLSARGGAIESAHGPQWVQVYVDLCRRVGMLLGGNGFTTILPGSAHLAIEMALRNVLPSGSRTIVVVNGYWGERLAQMGASLGHRVTVLAVGETAARPEKIGAALDRIGAAAVCVVHGETSTGALNPLEGIARETVKRGATLVVDAVATVGVVPISADEMGTCVIAANSSKGLGSETGLAIVHASSCAWEQIQRQEVADIGYFSSLLSWRDRRRDHQGASATIGSIAASQLRMLENALAAIEREGLEARHNRHCSITRVLHEALARRGLRVLNADSPLPTVTVAQLPEGRRAGPLVRQLFDAGVCIETGLGPGFAGSCIRVGHMGPSATDTMVERLLEALDNALERPDGP